jgi:hypothetical protein
MLKTIQDIVKAAIEFFYKLSQPKPELTMFEKLLIFFTNWFQFFIHKEVKKKKLFRIQILQCVNLVLKLIRCVLVQL